MNAVRRKYQTPLERISQVSNSPGIKKPPAASKAPQQQTSALPALDSDPLSMGQSYSSYYRIKQQKEQQQRLHYREELREKQEQIDKLKEEVIELKMTISELENKLQDYKYPATCDLQTLIKAFQIARRWLKHPLLRESRKFLLKALLEYFKKKDKRQFVYGRVLYWLLGLFETINGREQ